MIFDANEIDNRIRRNMYVVHTKGGPHMFALRCSKDTELNPLYRENIWPYIERICYYVKRKKGKNPSVWERVETEPSICIPSITKKDPYPRISFSPENNGPQVRTYVHQFLAMLLKSKIEGGCINHINGKPADYRLENLEWVTYKGNATGVARPKLDYDIMYDSFVKNKYI